MKTLGNIIWFLLAGFWLGLAYAIAGLINIVFIVTIPFGIASLRLAGFVVWPFGRVVIRKPGPAPLSTIGNVLWFFLGGFWLALAHLVTGVLLLLTVIGIPFGIANLKMARLALAPLGKMVVPAGSIGVADHTVFTVG